MRDTSTALTSHGVGPARSSLVVSLIAVIAAAGIGAGVITFFTLRTPATAGGTTADPPTTAAPPTAESIDIVLKADPPETRFYIDEGIALENPYVGKRPKESGSHTIRARAPGYKEKLRQVNFGENVSLGLLLDPIEKRDGSRK